MVIRLLHSTFFVTQRGVYRDPGERAEVALVFRGDKGCGKGTFADALKRCFGQHGLHISSSDHLVGQFNAHFRDCMRRAASSDGKVSL